jgi:hypothetical protein
MGKIFQSPEVGGGYFVHIPNLGFKNSFVINETMVDSIFNQDANSCMSFKKTEPSLQNKK